MFVSMCFCLTHFCTIFLLVFFCVYLFLHLLVFFVFSVFRNIHGFVPAWDYFRTEVSHLRRVLSPAGRSKISFKSGSHRQSWKRYGMVLKLFEKTRKWPDWQQNPENVTKKIVAPQKQLPLALSVPPRDRSEHDPSTPGTISQAWQIFPIHFAHVLGACSSAWWPSRFQQKSAWACGSVHSHRSSIWACASPSLRPQYRKYNCSGPFPVPVGSLFWSCFGLPGRGPEWDSGPFRAFAFGNCCGPCSGPFRSLCFPVPVSGPLPSWSLFPALCRSSPCFRPFLSVGPPSARPSVCFIVFPPKGL